MLTFLSLIAALFGGVSTVAAMTGDCFKKEEQSLLRRVSTRGWLAIGFLALAILLQIVRDKVAQDKADNEQRIHDSWFLTLTNPEATTVEIDFANKSSHDKSLDDLYFFSGIPDALRENATFSIHSKLTSNIELRIVCRTAAGNFKNTVCEAKNSPENSGPSELLAGRIDTRLNYSAKTVIPDHFILSQETQNGHHDASLIFNNLLKIRPEVTVDLWFSKKFASDADKNTFSKNHPGFKCREFVSSQEDMNDDLNGKGFLDCSFDLPEEAVKSFKRHWQRDFASATIKVWLGKSRLIIVSATHDPTIKIWKDQPMISASFKLDGNPRIEYVDSPDVQRSIFDTIALPQ